MSNFAEQAGAATDRPPDCRNLDDFPKTKSILWDKTSIGKPTLLHLGYSRKPRVCIAEKVLKLVQHQCENYGQKNHTLIGTLVVEDDGEGVQFQVDRLDVRPILSVDSSAHLAPGDLLIPLEVTNNAAGKRRGSVDDFVVAFKRLQERCCSKSSLELSSFVLLRGWVSFYSSAHSSVAHMDFDMVTMGTVFKATPIACVPIVLTALSKNLAGPMSLSQTQGMPKSGYLTMDSARKLLLVLESDPKAGTLPIVGIWVSGVDFIQHSFVWAACLRYIHNTHLQDRVCTPPQEFLLVVYSSLHSRPEFFQCSTTTGESKLIYELWSGHEVYNHSKSLSSQSDDFTEVELGSGENEEENALFNTALAKHRANVTSGHLEKSSSEDINPRSLPTPHSESFPVMKPMVPDVSILWTDSPNNSALPTSFPPTGPPAAYNGGQHVPYINNGIPSPGTAYQHHHHPATNVQSLSQTPNQPRPYMQSKIQRENTQCSTATQREIAQMSKAYISPGLEQMRSLPSSHSSPSMPLPGNVSCNSVRSPNYQTNFTTGPNANYSNSHRTPVNPQNYHHPSSLRHHTQTQATPRSIHPASCYPGVHPHSHSEFSSNYIDTSSHVVQSYPYPAGHHRPQHEMMPSSQGDAYYASQNVMDYNRMQPLPPTSQIPPQAVPSSTGLPVGCQSQMMPDNNVPPQWPNNFMLAHQHRNQEPPTGTPHPVWSPGSNQSHPVWTPGSNQSHMPPVGNQYVPCNPLKTVVEESSSSSSSSCKCNCSADKSVSRIHEDSVPRPVEGEAGMNRSSHNNSTGNNTKSSDDDSGLSVTPDRPNASPTPKATSVNGPNGNGSNAVGGAMAMNNVNWDQVPPEIRSLLIQQNEQLKMLQQQIQMLMMNTSQKSLVPPPSDLAASSSHPVSSSDSAARAMCTVAVNTSFPNEQPSTLQFEQHRHNCQKVPSPPRQPQSHERREDQNMSNNSPEVIHSRGPSPLHSTSYTALDTTESVLSSSESSHPEAQSNVARDYEQNFLSVSAELTKNSRSMNEGQSSEFETNRSQLDPSYPNDSDFYNNGEDESYSTLAEEATDPRQFYDQLMNNIQMFLSNGEEESPTPSDKDDQTSPLHESITKVPDSANSTLFPHINYMSMMLGANAETGQSMEINAMAMKYLKDDQLTQMAMMMKNNEGCDTQTTNRLLQRMITAGGNKTSSEISQLGISPNNLTMGTRNYLEKHGLLGNESQFLNDNSVFDHTFKLKTDFSMAMTDSDKSSGMFKSPGFSPRKNYERTELAQMKFNPSSSSARNEGTKENRRQENNFVVKNIPKDVGASPVLMPPKHYNMAQAPMQPGLDKNLPRARHGMFDNCSSGDNADSENILDIAKLKQLPKLL